MMNRDENKNLLLAIVLSAVVLLGWNYFYGMPQMEAQRRAAQPTQPAPAGSVTPAPGGAGSVAPVAGAPGVVTPGSATPGAAAVATAAPGAVATRAAALEASARVRIDTPRIVPPNGKLQSIPVSRYNPARVTD